MRERNCFHTPLLLIISLLVVVSCDKREAKTVDVSRVAEASKTSNVSSQAGVYIFGFDVRHGPQEDARQYLPLMKYLENQTGYKFKLMFTPKDKSTAQMLGEKKFDFAAMGATSYISSKQKYPVISLVRGLNTQGKSKYQSFLVTRPSSRITKLDDIKGHSFAFGSINSTQGHLIPRIMLREHNIQLSDLKSYIYTGSHRNCAEAVISKKVDVCGMQDTLAKEMVTQGRLRVLHRSYFYPSSGIAANLEVDKKVRDAVQEALIHFQPKGKDEAGLYHWEKTEMPNGFELANEKDYQSLREWMVKFEMIN